MNGYQPSLGKQIAYNILLICICLAVLYPALRVLRMALYPDATMAMNVPLFSGEFSLQSFWTVLSNDNPNTPEFDGDWIFLRQFWNSTVIALMTSVIGMAFSCTAAYGMSRFTFPGKERGMSLFLITQMFPGVVMAIPLYILMDRLGLLNSAFGLALAYSATAVPFCTWNLKGYFDTIPQDLEDAARIDGASQWIIFTQIVLPLSKPALSVTALFSFMTAWNEFILAATFLSDSKSYTLPVLLQSYVGNFGAEWNLFAAGAILTSTPVMLLFFFLQRNLVEGLTSGSVKG